MFQDPSTRYRNLTLLLGSTLTAMGGLVIAPSVAGMGRHFSDVPNVEFLVSLSVTLPSLMVALCSFSVGALVDRYGRRPILLGSALLCGLMGCAGYFLNSLAVILLTRLLLGVGIAGLLTSITTVAGDVFMEDERKRFLGLQSMAMNMGGIFFVGLGGALADISWRMPFTLYSFALLLMVAFIVFIPETRQKNTAKKNTVEKNNHSAGSPPDEQAGKPILILTTLFIVCALTSSFFYMSPVLMAQVFENINLNATKVGIALALLSLSSALIGPQFQRLANKLGTLSTLIWISACLSIGYFTVGTATSFATMSIGLIITGLGLGVFIPLAFSYGMAAVHNRYLGLAIGTATSAMFFGQFLAPIAGTLLQSTSLQSAFLNAANIACGLSACLIARKIYQVYKSTDVQSVENKND